MSVPVQSSRTGRRLSASGRARRAKRAAARRRRQMMLSGAIAFTAVIAAPFSVASYLGVEASLPGVAAAKSFLAMMAERSPGDRTKAELTRTKERAAAAPKQRALGKIAPPPPKEFVEAIAPSAPKVAEGVPLAMAPATLGPLLITPSTPGGIVISPSAPPLGGGGGGGGGGPSPSPGEEPNPTQPPPPVVDEPQPPPPGDDGLTPTPTVQPPTTPPPVVPEPGTWATMLLGFGMTGLMIRRRRRKAALA